MKAARLCLQNTGLYTRNVVSNRHQISRQVQHITSSIATPSATTSRLSVNTSLATSSFINPTRVVATPPSMITTHRTNSHRRSITCSASSSTREIRVSHILLPTDAESLMKDLEAKIKSGETTLAALAAQHSSCPSKESGGDIGFISTGRTVPEFEAAAFGAKVGEIATCKTQFGLHILQVTEEREAMQVDDMSVQQLQELLEVVTTNGGDTGDIQFIDVREESEAEIAKLPHFTLMPTSQFQQWAPKIAAGEQLDKEKETVVLCHHGMRSMQVAMFLVGQGFRNVRNVTGGINAYSLMVDPSVKLY